MSNNEDHWRDHFESTEGGHRPEPPADPFAAALRERWESMTVEERYEILKLGALAAVEQGAAPEPYTPLTSPFMLELQGLVRATYALTPEGEKTLREGRERWRAKVAGTGAGR